jgi:hypothetical protein
MAQLLASHWPGVPILWRQCEQTFRRFQAVKSRLAMARMLQSPSYSCLTRQASGPWPPRVLVSAQIKAMIFMSCTCSEGLSSRVLGWEEAAPIETCLSAPTPSTSKAQAKHQESIRDWVKPPYQRGQFAETAGVILKCSLTKGQPQGLRPSLLSARRVGRVNEDLLISFALRKAGSAIFVIQTVFVFLPTWAPVLPADSPQQELLPLTKPSSFSKRFKPS